MKWRKCKGSHDTEKDNGVKIQKRLGVGQPLVITIVFFVLCAFWALLPGALTHFGLCSKPFRSLELQTAASAVTKAAEFRKKNYESCENQKER